MVAEVGCQGRDTDGGVFRNSPFNLTLSKNSSNLPDPKPLPASNDLFWVTAGEAKKIQMVFVADDTFTLTKHCMKAYGRRYPSDEERVFDYRCSCFQRISENAFGIRSNRFRLFATRTSLTPETSLLRTKSRESYTPIGSINFENDAGEIVEGTWHQKVISTNVADLRPDAPCRTSITAKEVRNELKLHFNEPGQIPFQ